uniref:Pentapeptide repeat-containing protein n=1 Tax=Romanomermis culicivorax TaxID=13658 RepID=A0A915J1M2_ROMCU
MIHSRDTFAVRYDHTAFANVHSFDASFNTANFTRFFTNQHRSLENINNTRLSTPSKKINN